MSRQQLQAAQVHDQISPADVPLRKPTRLDALPTLQPIKKKQRNRDKCAETDYY